MSLSFVVKKGPLEGKKFALKDGMTIGRSKGDIPLQDIKASAQHAQIKLSRNGTLVLVDSKSTNGTKVDGRKVKKIALKPGLVVQIGSSFLQVVEDAETMKAPTQSEPALKAPQKPKPEPEVISVDLEPLSWSEFLENYSKDIGKKIKDRPKALAALNPAVTITFVRGVQTDTIWTLGYGPRKIGAKSLDLPIFEPGAPELCFEVFPSLDGITFKTNHPDIVQLNDQAIASRVLKHGDVITVNDTKIEIGLNE